MEKFALGVIIGGLGGALLVANNYKMRTLVKKTQDEMHAKLDKMLNEKIDAVEEITDEIKEQVKEGGEKLTKKAERTMRKVKKAATE